MVERRGGWKIPAQLAGTESDNFATRSLEGIQGEIETIIRQLYLSMMWLKEVLIINLVVPKTTAEKKKITGAQWEIF